MLLGCSQPKAPQSSIKLAQHGLLSANLSPRGDLLFTGSFQHGGALWKQNSQARIFDWNHSDEGYSAYITADFSEDGRYLAATDGSAVIVWDTNAGNAKLFLESPEQSLGIQNSRAIWQSADGESEAYWRKPARIVDLAFSKQYLLLGLENQIALLVSMEDQSIIGALGHDDVLTHVAMNDEATIAVTGTRNGLIKIWSLQDGSVTREHQYSSPISFLHISGSGSHVIVSASQGPVTLFNPDQALADLVIFKGNPGVIAAHFSRDDKLLLGSSRELLWQADMSTGEIQNTWQVPKKGPWHNAAILAVHESAGSVQAISSDGVAYKLN